MNSGTGEHELKKCGANLGPASSFCAAILAGVLSAIPVAGATEQPELSVDRIALELSNPATSLRTFRIDFEHRKYQGSLPGIDGEKANMALLDLSWPFRLKNGKTLFLSTTVPIHGSQPIWDRSPRYDFGEFLVRRLPEEAFERGGMVNGHGHVDDISFNIGYGGVSEKGLIAKIGVETRLPTSTDNSTDRDQILLGPEIALGKSARWGLIAATVKHLTNVSEDVDGVIIDKGGGPYFYPGSTNETTLKINFAYSLGRGWQVESNPVILYDWEAVSDNEWLVPLGAGVSNTFRVGSTYLKFAAELQKYVVSPDRFGPDWMLSFSVIPVLSTKLLQVPD